VVKGIVLFQTHILSTEYYFLLLFYAVKFSLPVIKYLLFWRFGLFLQKNKLGYN
jgi:hypothetical protein